MYSCTSGCQAGARPCPETGDPSAQVQRLEPDWETPNPSRLPSPLPLVRSRQVLPLASQKLRLWLLVCMCGTGRKLKWGLMQSLASAEVSKHKRWEHWKQNTTQKIFLLCTISGLQLYWWSEQMVSVFTKNLTVWINGCIYIHKKNLFDSPSHHYKALLLTAMALQFNITDTAAPCYCPFQYSKTETSG